ncbi:HDOD domain-containing protein [bacterium AH-315-F18]|nr:HDOD domain-containing protein [bacterium AH-315-F18]
MAKATKSKRVSLLVIDTNEKLCEVLAHNLERYGYDVLLSSSNRSGYLKAVQNRPTLILLGLGANDFGDGLRTCRSLKASKHTSSIPVILKGPFEDRESVVHAIQAGASDLLSAPVKFGVLLEKLCQHVESMGLEVPVPRGGDALASHEPEDFEIFLLDADIPAPDKLEALRRRVSEVLAFPHTLLMVMKITGDDNSGAKALARCISGDTAICGALLKLANSVYYAKAHSRVSDIQEAIVRIGFRVVKSLVMGIKAMNMFSSEKESLGFKRIDFWFHNIAVAVIATQLAQRANYRSVEDAYVAGLLHDIGKLTLDECFPNVFQAVLERRFSDSCSMYRAELEVMGISHDRIGRDLLESWNLSPRVVKAVEYHHTIERAEAALAGEDLLLARIIATANQLAKALLIGNGGDMYISSVSREVWRAVGCDDASSIRSHQFIRQIYKEVNVFYRFFNLGIDDLVPPFDAGTHVEGRVLVFNEDTSVDFAALTLLTQGYSVRHLTSASGLGRLDKSEFDLIAYALPSSTMAGDTLATCKPVEWEAFHAGGSFDALDAALALVEQSDGLGSGADTFDADAKVKATAFLEEFEARAEAAPLLLISPKGELLEDIEDIRSNGLRWSSFDASLLVAAVEHRIHGPSLGVPQRGLLDVDEERIRKFEAELKGLRS